MGPRVCLYFIVDGNCRSIPLQNTSSWGYFWERGGIKRHEKEGDVCFVVDALRRAALLIHARKLFFRWTVRRTVAQSRLREKAMFLSGKRGDSRLLLESTSLPDIQSLLETVASPLRFQCLLISYLYIYISLSLSLSGSFSISLSVVLPICVFTR